MTRITKKVVKKTAKKTMKKSVIKTFYGMMHTNELKNINSSDGEEVWLQSCKSDHMNHVVNSYLLNNKTDNTKDTLLVKVEILGQPLVKTTREITIKK